VIKKIFVVIMIIFILYADLYAKKAKPVYTPTVIPTPEILMPEILLPENQMPVNGGELFKYKSPGISMIHTLYDPRCGDAYALDEDPEFLSVQTLLLGLGIADVSFSNLTTVPARAVLWWGGAGLIGSAYIYDFISGASTASDKAVKFISHAKKTEMPVEGEEQFYRDPMLAAGLSLLSAGAGKWYAGDYDNIIIITIVDAFLGYVCPIVWMATPQGSDPVHYMPGMLAIGGVCYRVFNMVSNAFYTDKPNEEYFKQAVCPNSKFRVRETGDIREPSIALALAMLFGGALPGIGNFYAGNQQAAFTLLAAGAAGWATVLVTPHISALDGNAKSSYFWLGLGVIAFSYLYDMVSAPGSAEIHNAVYCGSNMRAEYFEPELAVYPSVVEKGMGISVACAF
jgi:hypothetical protein